VGRVPGPAPGANARLELTAAFRPSKRLGREVGLSANAKSV